MLNILNIYLISGGTAALRLCRGSGGTAAFGRHGGSAALPRLGRHGGHVFRIPFQPGPLKGIPKAYRMLIGAMVTGRGYIYRPGPEITRGYILIISGV